jgi:hypothetical protein
MAFLAAAGLVMVLFGLGAYYATDELSPFSITNLVLGPVLLIVTAIAQGLRTTGFRGAMPRRVAGRWIAILAGTTVVVVLVNASLSNWGTMFDLTTEGLFTLSPQTLDVLREMDEAEGAPPRLLLFVDAPFADEAQPLVQAYSNASARLEVPELRLAEAPPEARPHVSYEPAVVACWTGRCEASPYVAEDSITTALVRLLNAREVRAEFMVGHGEIDLTDESEDGYSLLAEVLRTEGFVPHQWVGPARASAPEGADVVVVGNPERDLLPAELETLEKYVADGGRLLALLEPETSTNLEDLLRRWGFGIPGGILVDPRSSPLLREPRPVSLVVNSFSPDHPITKRLSIRTMMLFPTARAVFAERKPQPDDRMREIAYASPYGGLETDVRAALLDRPLSPGPDELQGREIPLAAAAAYPRGETEARIVVIGDRDFASNRLLDALYNRDLLLNALHWLVEQDRRITLRPKAWTPRQDPLTIQETLSFFYFFAFALPELLLLLGIHAWFRQRR